jgi:hypothetical protein
MTSDIPAPLSSRRGTLWFGELQRSWAYDLMMRLPLLAWSAGCTMTSVNGLVRYLDGADPGLPHAVYVVNVAMRLSAIVFLVLLAFRSFCGRGLREERMGWNRGLPPSPAP